MQLGYAKNYPEWVEYVMKGVMYLMNADMYNVTFYGKRLHIKKIDKDSYLAATTENMRTDLLKDKFRELINKIGLSNIELPCAWNEGNGCRVVIYKNTVRAFVCGKCISNCSVCNRRRQFDMFDLYRLYSGRKKFIDQKNFFIRAFVEDGGYISNRPSGPIK